MSIFRPGFGLESERSGRICSIRSFEVLLDRDESAGSTQWAVLTQLRHWVRSLGVIPHDQPAPSAPISSDRLAAPSEPGSADHLRSGNTSGKKSARARFHMSISWPLS